MRDYFRMPTVNEIKEHDVTIYLVLKEDIINKNYTGVDSLFNSFDKSGRSGKRKLVIGFDGYDDVPEPIYEIPEIREYVKGMFEKHPNMFYFISDFQSLNRFIFTCLCDFIAIKTSNDVNLKVHIPADLVDEMSSATFKYGLAAGETPEAMNKFIEHFYLS